MACADQVPEPSEIAIQFHEAINARNLDRLGELMTSDHRFIDSAGNTIEGKPACLQAWRGFFSAFPDYRNVVSQICSDNAAIAMAGHSTCCDPRLDGPALWRAVVSAGLLSEWQVMEDVSENRVLIGIADST